MGTRGLARRGLQEDAERGLRWGECWLGEGWLGSGVLKNPKPNASYEEMSPDDKECEDILKKYSQDGCVLCK